MENKMKERFISESVNRIRPSLIREISTLAEKFDDVIPLGIGEPDFHTAAPICEGALKDALAGATHYAPIKGDPELIDALKTYLNSQYPMDIEAKNLIVTGGGMGALIACFRTLFNSGDDILVPGPYFPAYRAQIELAGGNLVHIETTFEQGFQITMDAVKKALTPKTKAIIINSPHNPTGTVIPAETLDALADFAKEKNLMVISDEVYDRLLFDGLSHESIASRPGMTERTIIIGSFSKMYAMTGWRVGYLIAPDWFINEMSKVVMFYTACAPSVSQRGALAALRMDQSWVGEMREEFQQRRDLVYGALSRMKGIRVHEPKGSFYIFPNVAGVAEDSTQFAFDLLEKEHVAVVPGAAFGPSGDACVRISFTVDQKRLTEGMERMARYIENR